MNDTLKQIKRTYKAWALAIVALIHEPIKPILNPSVWRIRWFGIFLIIGNPVFYWLWTTVFPQPFEFLPLRLMCSAFGVIVLLENNSIMTGRRFWRWFYFAVMFIQLPLFFLYMASLNEWNNVWLGSCVAMVLIYYQGTDWRLASGGVLIAGAVVGFNHFVQFQDTWYCVALLTFLSVFVFAWIAALILGASTANLQKQYLLNTAYNLGVMAYELRTPISSIGILSSVLRKKYQNSEDLDLYNLSLRLDVLVKTINVHIDNQIINSKIIDIKKTDEIISSKNLIESVILAFPFKNDIERNVVQYCCIDDFNFNASSTLFTQVLNNLIRNAFKAMAVKEISDGMKKIQITSFVNKQSFGKPTAAITMTDNGTGIKPEHLKKILEPFFSTNDAIDHGLGLLFCKKVVVASKVA